MIEDLQKRIGYAFQDQDLLAQALTHSSVKDESNYERLEFLGDRVLGLIVAELLFNAFPDEKEGDIAKRHAALVQGPTLAEIATELNLGAVMNLSDAERVAGGFENENILSDVFEALLGALYLDGGLEPVKKLLSGLLKDRLHTFKAPPQDPKTELQEWLQARGHAVPEYRIIEKEGPDHAPVFVIELLAESQSPVQARGPSRRQAEKAAAEKMLSSLKSGS